MRTEPGGSGGTDTGRRWSAMGCRREGTSWRGGRVARGRCLPGSRHRSVRWWSRGHRPRRPRGRRSRVPVHRGCPVRLVPDPPRAPLWRSRHHARRGFRFARSRPEGRWPRARAVSARAGRPVRLGLHQQDGPLRRADGAFGCPARGRPEGCRRGEGANLRSVADARAWHQVSRAARMKPWPVRFVTAP